MKITNTGRAPRGIPVGTKIVEVESGASFEMTDDNWDAIKDRPDVSALIEDGTFVAEGVKTKAKKEPKPDPIKTDGGAA